MDAISLSSASELEDEELGESGSGVCRGCCFCSIGRGGVDLVSVFLLSIGSCSSAFGCLFGRPMVVQTFSLLLGFNVVCMVFFFDGMVTN